MQTKNKSKILFLHHSTGGQIVQGRVPKYIYKFTNKGSIHNWFDKYNRKNKTKYEFTDQVFPKKEPYGWNNYPYDYYTIWIKNCGFEPFMTEPTLEILTQNYDLIIFKHCYPVCRIENDQKPNINSPKKTISNYKLQYEALKEKFYQFTNTKFLVWTGAALVKGTLTDDQAKNAREFFRWIREEWDETGDNIFIFDFYELETEGGVYLKPEYARGINNSHVSLKFAKKTYPLFCQRIVDVIEGRGDISKITGE